LREEDESVNPAPQSDVRPPVVLLASNEVTPPEVEIARAWLTLRDVIVIEVACRLNIASTEPDPLLTAKLNLCDEVYVLNFDGWSSNGLGSLVRAAGLLRKPVQFYERNVNTEIGFRSTNGVQTNESPSGVYMDLVEPFVVRSGAVLSFGSTQTRSVHSLVAGHMWPGLRYAPEVWYGKTLSSTVIEPYKATAETLEYIGRLISWTIRTSGSVGERSLAALHALGSVQTHDELAAVIGCRRESITIALRELGRLGLVERRGPAIRLTDAGRITIAIQIPPSTPSVDITP
jgi:hypothetical protein